MPASDRERPSSRLAWIVLCLALVGSASMLYYHLGLFMPRVREAAAARNLAGRYSFGNDFYPVWLTSGDWLRERRDPYSPEVTREIQAALFGRPLDERIPTDPVTDYRTFAYPAFTDLLFWPAAEIPFPILRIALAALLAALTLASVTLWIRALAWRPGGIWLAVAFLLTLCSYPVLEGLYADQLGLLVGFFLAASLAALLRNRLLLSGILMALTTIKPQMTVLALLYLTVWSLCRWRERRLFCVGFFSTSALLVGAALVVWPHWIQSWLHVVFGYHRYGKPPLLSEVLTVPLGPGADNIAALLLTAMFLFIALALAWRNRAAPPDSGQFWLTLSFLLAITAIALLPGQAVHDHVILLPGIFLLAKSWRALWSNSVAKLLLVVVAGVVVWPWVASLGLILARPLLTHEQFYSKAVFALPVRTAAVFPFIVLGLLAVARRALATDHADSPSC